MWGLNRSHLQKSYITHTTFLPRKQLLLGPWSQPPRRTHHHHRRAQQFDIDEAEAESKAEADVCVFCSGEKWALVAGAGGVVAAGGDKVAAGAEAGVGGVKPLSQVQTGFTRWHFEDGKRRRLEKAKGKGGKARGLGTYVYTCVCAVVGRSLVWVVRSFTADH